MMLRSSLYLKIQKFNLAALIILGFHNSHCFHEGLCSTENTTEPFSECLNRAGIIIRLNGRTVNVIPMLTAATTGTTSRNNSTSAATAAQTVSETEARSPSANRADQTLLSPSSIATPLSTISPQPSPNLLAVSPVSSVDSQTERENRERLIQERQNLIQELCDLTGRKSYEFSAYTVYDLREMLERSRSHERHRLALLTTMGLAWLGGMTFGPNS